MPYQARTAFVDESFRRGQDGHGYYFLGAALVADELVVELERGLRAHVP